jgi:type III pantothenate kinase
MGILAVDVGNTVTRYGAFDGSSDGMEPSATWDIATRDTLTADEARLLLRGLLNGPGGTVAPRGDGRRAPEPHDGIVSCVVPSLTAVYASALEAEFGRRPLVVGPGIKTGMRMHYSDPAEIGPDRIADMVAAKAAYRVPLAIVDMGTAMNIMVLDAEGVFVGGIIGPGLALSTRALSRASARLPVIEVGPPVSVIGKSTREAMQAGLVLGEAARIDGLLDMVFGELGQEGEVVVTGADADAVAGLLAHTVTVDGTLTLRGLARLYHINRRKKEETA